MVHDPGVVTSPIGYVGVFTSQKDRVFILAYTFIPSSPPVSNHFPKTLAAGRLPNQDAVVRNEIKTYRICSSFHDLFNFRLG